MINIKALLFGAAMAVMGSTPAFAYYYYPPPPPYHHHHRVRWEHHYPRHHVCYTRWGRAYNC